MSSTMPEPDVRGWAAAQLELKPDVTPEQVRTALLRRLPEDDFVLPYRCQQAALFLLRPADGTERILHQGQALYDEEDRLRIEVDAFAADFFKLAGPERRRRWQELRGRCAFCPPLAARLDGLEKGLDVALDKVAATEMRDLAERVGDLFVLRPAARAVRRQELLSEMGSSAGRWQAAARQLQKQAPTVAALAPGLVDELATWEQRRQQQQRRAAGQRVQQQLPVGGKLSGRKLGADNGTELWRLVAAVAMIIVAFCALQRGPGGSSSPSLPVPTKSVVPAELKGADGDEERWRDDELLKRFREMQQKEKDIRRDKPADPQPGPRPPP
jgi:hypothetical protein